MRHVTFDTGALIGIERRRLRMLRVYQTLREDGVAIHVPGDVVAEWWRGRTDERVRLLDAVLVEPVSEAIGRVAGEALARVEGATTVDAIVMATAARFGGIVYTSDVEDLERLREAFPGVRVLSA